LILLLLWLNVGQLIGCAFVNSNSLHCLVTRLGIMVHTQVLCRKQYDSVPVKGRLRSAARKARGWELPTLCAYITLRLPKFCLKEENGESIQLFCI